MKNNIILKDKLYNLISLNTDIDGIITANIELNRECSIFRGHFPNLPVLPGVCALQIVREIASIYFNQFLYILKISSVKYLTLINLEVNNDLKVKIILSDNKGDCIVMDAVFYIGEKAVIKISDFILASSLNIRYCK